MGNACLNRILKVGLTGGIASGKSTVCKLFNELGVPVIDADQIAHELVQPNQPALNNIIEILGKKYLDKKGQLDRTLLRNAIFNDAVIKQKLEAILHPLVYEEIDNKIALFNAPYCIVCIPLLIETDALNKVDRVLLVDLPKELQLDRANKRDNVEKSEINKIIQTQVERKIRLEAADEIIKNDEDMDKLKTQVTNLHNFYTNLAKDNKVNSA
jgi:dephospho-CoA kinase